MRDRSARCVLQYVTRTGISGTAAAAVAVVSATAETATALTTGFTRLTFPGHCHRLVSSADIWSVASTRRLLGLTARRRISKVTMQLWASAVARRAA